MSFGDIGPANVAASRRIGLKCAVLFVYGLAFYALFMFAAVFEIDTSASIWYPPAGLRLAVLLILGWRFGGLILCAEAVSALATGAIGAWGVTGAGASDLPRIAGLMASVAIPPACYTFAAFSLERWTRPEAAKDPFTGILYFLFLAALAASANGIAIALNHLIHGLLSWSEFRAVAGGIAIGDLIGILTFTPVLLLAARHIARHTHSAPALRPSGAAWIPLPIHAAAGIGKRALIEGACVSLFAAAALAAASHQYAHPGIVHWYPFLLPVIWLALRFGLPAAMIGTFAMNVAAAAVAATFGDVETFQDVQIFMVTLSVTGLLMGSVVSELRNEKAKLDLRVRARTRNLSAEIERRERAEHAALGEKQRAESYLAIAQPVIIAVDLDARITLVNNSAIRLLGCQRKDLLGRDWIELVATKAERPRLRSIHCALIKGEPAGIPTFQTRVRLRDGGIRVIDWRSALIRGDDESIVGILCSGDDITERIAAEEKLRYLASHDPVTGLHNRHWLLDHFPRAIARSRRHGALLAILFIDLTGFKQINDNYGHAHGDRTLTATAARLKQCVRVTDTVTRLGGDEFVVLLEDVGKPQDAVRIAKKILRAIAQPLHLEKNQIGVGASIGIAFFPDDGTTAEELLSKADAAMYLAKHGQPHGYHLAPGAGDAWQGPAPAQSVTPISHAVRHGGTAE